MTATEEQRQASGWDADEGLERHCAKGKGEGHGPGEAGRSAEPERGSHGGQRRGTAVTPAGPSSAPTTDALAGPTAAHSPTGRWRGRGRVSHAHRTLLQAATRRVRHTPLTAQTRSGGRGARCGPNQPCASGCHLLPAWASPSLPGSPGCLPASVAMATASSSAARRCIYSAFLCSPRWVNSPRRLSPHVGCSSLKAL